MRRKNKKKDLFLVLVLAILGIGLGYAFLTQNLTINGVSKTRGNNWNIYFTNLIINNQSTSLTEGDSGAVIDSNDPTQINCRVHLKLPGDFYEFTVDAVNKGTLDAMLDGIYVKLNNNSNFTLPPYLTYSVTAGDGNEVLAHHLLEIEESYNYKIRVEFLKDIEIEDLPDEPASLAFTFEIRYVQSDDNAVSRYVPFYASFNTMAETNPDPSWEYYVGGKGISTIATEDLYVVREYSGDEVYYVYDNRLKYLDYEYAYDVVMENGGNIEKVVNAGDSYIVPFKTQEVYLKINSSIISLKLGKWDCEYDGDTCTNMNSYILSKKIEAENLGFTCSLNSDYLSCALGDKSISISDDFIGVYAAEYGKTCNAQNYIFNNKIDNYFTCS